MLSRWVPDSFYMYDFPFLQVLQKLLILSIHLSIRYYRKLGAGREKMKEFERLMVGGSGVV